MTNIFLIFAGRQSRRGRKTMVPLRTDREIAAALDEIPLLSEEDDDFLSGAGSMADITRMLEGELPNGK